MAYNPTNPNGQATSANSSPVVIASNQTSIPTTFPSYVLDAFNQVIIGERVNDVQCVWAGSGTVNTLTNPVFTGTGAASWTGGQVLFSTGATNPSTVYAPTISTVTYTPGAEIFVYFTAYFTTTGTAGTFQRYGLTDKVNGVFLGMESNVFNVSLITNGSITSVAQTAFNVDKLTGAVGSKFTRAGIPESINLANQNVFRVRFGWVGSAPIIYEVLSPDDEWVVFHINRVPNSQNTPSIQNPNLPVSAWMNGLGANLTMGTSCWAAGTSSPYAQKGVSSGSYMPVQNAKDTSRTYVMLYLDSITGLTTEALSTMNINIGGTITTGTSYTVPVNKILRIQSLTVTLRSTSTTAIYGRIRVRSGTTVSATSGIIMMADIPRPVGSAATGTGTTITYNVSDNIEISSGQQVGISQILNSALSAVSVLVTGYIY